MGEGAEIKVLLSKLAAWVHLGELDCIGFEIFYSTSLFATMITVSGREVAKQYY